MSKNTDKEFGFAPEELPITHEVHDRPPKEEFPVIREEVIPEEMAKVPPEFSRPGEAPWAAAKEKGEGRKAWTKMAMTALAAVLVVAMGIGLLHHRASGAPEGESTQTAENSSQGDNQGDTQTAENSNQESGEPGGRPDESSGEEPGREDSFEQSEGSGGESGSEPSEEQGGESSEGSGEPEKYVEPDAEIIAVAFYSEMMATVDFSDMEDVTDVRFEIWDTLTNELDESRDITAQARTELHYNMDVFTTDFIYEHHQEAYDAINDFPMEVEIRVVMTYDSAEGEKEKTVSSVTTPEMLWEAMYFPADYGVENLEDGGARISFMKYDGPWEVVFNDPEKVKDNIASLKIEVNGTEIDYSDILIENDSYEAYMGEGEEPRTVYYTDLSLPLSQTGEEGSNTAVLTFTVYLESYEKTFTYEQKIRF